MFPMCRAPYKAGTLEPTNPNHTCRNQRKGLFRSARPMACGLKTPESLNGSKR